MARGKTPWPVDPDVRKTGMGGLPPAGHARRCQGTNQRIKTQCPEWARKGSFYCKVHGGNIRKKGRRIGNMAGNIYVHRASEALKSLLDKATESGRFDSLEDEIAVSRAMCQRSVAVYDEVHFGEKAAAFNGTIKASASKHLRQCLNDIGNLLARHAAIKAASDSTFSVEQVEEMRGHFLRILERHLGIAEYAPVYEAILKDIADVRVQRKDDRQVVIAIQ